MIFIFTTIFFIFGLIIGSFLNVVIVRFNTQRSFFGSFGGRSGCMSCQNKLTWYELIPVFSFLGLKGRCRNCQTKISIQYPLVEFVTGFIFAALFLKLVDLPGRQVFFDLTFFIVYAYYAAMFSLLIVIATYDFRHKIIPDVLVFIFSVFAFVGLFFFDSSGIPFSYSFRSLLHFPTLLEFFSGPLIALPFAFFYFISRGRWMGLGDAKLALGIGYLLGFSIALSALVLAFWVGAIVGIILVIFSKKYGMKSEIPFAPYLVLGTLLAFLFELHLF